MNTEFEIKILDINIDELTELFKSNDFEEKQVQEFKRYVYELPNKNAWIRLRTDGQLTTLTYKLFEKNSIDGVQELEIEVSDFDKTHQLLTLSGLQAKTYQENRRRRFVTEDVEFSIDEWPLIPAYLEIEGSNEKTVKRYISELNLEDLHATSEPTSAVYALYNVNIDDYPHLAFKDETL